MRHFSYLKNESIAQPRIFCIKYYTHKQIRKKKKTAKKIVVLRGDHFRKEITKENIKVLKAIEFVRPNVKFKFQHHLSGGGVFDTARVPLPDEALEVAKKVDAVLLSAVGGSKWGTGSIRLV